MSKPKRPVVAICYDFDGTLSPKNMQEYKFIPELRTTPKKFWAEAQKRAKDTQADPILAYMTLMLDSARSARVPISRTAIVSYGRNVELFPGVTDWFDRINVFASNAYKLKVEHYIISSGLKEMIEGSQIARKFTKIFASSFAYNADNVAEWPAVAVNFTTKTQFLFRINKGKFVVWDEKGINKYVADKERPIPFSRMIYIGDGSTDIPCMKLTKEQGGYSIAVYKSGSTTGKTKSLELLNDDRVNFIAPADFSESKDIERQVKEVLNKIAAEAQLQKEVAKCHPREASTRSNVPSTPEVEA